MMYISRCWVLCLQLVLLCPGGLRMNKLFKSLHVWHADAEQLAPYMFPQMPKWMAAGAMHYVSRSPAAVPC